MNRWKVLMLWMVACLLVVPVASAEKEHAVDDIKASPVSSGKDYIVSPWVGNFNTEISIKSTQYISQGQTITHNVNVGSGVNYLEVDLNWGDTGDSLTLSIYTPSGSKVGTYRDSSDRSVNGRIRLTIDPSQGYVEQGTWKFKVYGESVSGSESYTFNVYQH